MYVQPILEESRIEVLRDLADKAGLGVLVVAGVEGIDANHIPFEVAHDLTQLRAHIARENPLWRSIEARTEALVIFQGPHHYISPTWQPGHRTHGRVAPTWNYVVCHIYGALSIVEDETWLRDHMQALTDREEKGRPNAWRVDRSTEGFVEALMPHIVGLRIDVTRVVGKAQASQQYGAAAREGVITGLEAERSDRAAEMARAISGYRP